MTSEEALKGLIKERDLEKANRDIWDESEDRIRSDKYVEMLNIAIKALEKELALDKIRAEIEEQREEVSKKHSENDELQAYYHGLNDGLKDARDIIDKYKSESEG